MYTEIIPGGSSKTVLFFGWYEAQKRHMEKYTKLYSQRGYHVVAVANRLNQFAKGLKPLFRFMVSAIEEHKLDEGDIVIHACSGAGVQKYSEFKHYLKHNNLEHLLRNHKGTVIECGPGPWHFPLLWRSVTYHLAWPLKILVGFVMALLYLIFPRIPFLSRFFHTFDQIKRLDKQMIGVKQPQLFLYSANDSQVPPWWVEPYIDQQRKDGANVKAVKFTAEHMSLLKDEAERYTAALDDFLRSLPLISNPLTAPKL